MHSRYAVLHTTLFFRTEPTACFRDFRSIMLTFLYHAEADVRYLAVDDRAEDGDVDLFWTDYAQNKIMRATVNTNGVYNISQTETVAVNVTGQIPTGKCGDEKTIESDRSPVLKLYFGNGCGLILCLSFFSLALYSSLICFCVP